ncbi:MAG: cadherin repeat domain-containing protein [Bacteroidales bacterium]|nr:cadherin repeat domain-containing protein [Bacteroidales bacterium]
MKIKIVLTSIVFLMFLFFSCEKDEEKTLESENQAPVLSEISNQKVSAGETKNIELSATDIDGDSLSFIVIENPGFISIIDFMQTGNTAIATLVIEPEIDITGNYYATIQVIDSKSDIDSVSFIIEVINEPPTNIVLSNNTVIENDTIYTLVGIFSTIDSDSSDIHSYKLISGNGDIDNNSYIISDNRLLTNEIFDFEIKKSYSIRVQTTDQAGNSYEKVFKISILDVPECENIEGEYSLSITFSFNESGISGSGITKHTFPVSITQEGCNIEVRRCSGTIDNDGNVSFSGIMFDNLTQYYEGTLNTTSGIISGSVSGNMKISLWNGITMQSYTVTITDGSFELTPN